ncbi:oplophorus-luciferin 2-monooxygenase non-catalytic subunit-like [Macrobrachium nipponense]|uniref:oplophorus-luciferin 2-monooxygenase non-catalytic subunit-like n=1 Tax=Macrobrachium nipponense TaxID=159736 RepID=UPI0030C844F0
MLEKKPVNSRLKKGYKLKSVKSLLIQDWKKPVHSHWKKTRSLEKACTIKTGKNLYNQDWKKPVHSDWKKTLRLEEDTQNGRRHSDWKKAGNQHWKKPRLQAVSRYIWSRRKSFHPPDALSRSAGHRPVHLQHHRPLETRPGLLPGAKLRGAPRRVQPILRGPPFPLLHGAEHQGLEASGGRDVRRGDVQELLLPQRRLGGREPNVFLGSRGFLQYLTLDRQNLTTFPYEEISQHGILRTLSFSGNRISAFPTLESSSLESLDLSFNPISDIPADGLAGLPYLFDFTCEDCGLTEIHPGTFAGRKRLSGLILRSNNLTHLPENMVQSDYYSVGILVEDNQISNVSAGAFKLGPGQNMHVNLANNRLEQLEERVWRPYFEGGLTYLYAEGNPFSCGCDIAWLVTETAFMAKLGGKETCKDGRLVQTLDPLYYEEMC